MVFGARIDAVRLGQVIQTFSSRAHALNYDILSVLKFLGQHTDQQLKDIFVAAGEDSSTADGHVTEVRTWEAAAANYCQNYIGAGSVSDASYHFAKLYNPNA